MKRTLLVLLAAVGALAPAVPVVAAETSCGPGFSFQPRHHPALQVIVYRPQQATAEAPVLLALHGVGRRADRMCAEWKPYADRTGTVVVAPLFAKDAYSKGRSSFNLGGILAGEPMRPATQSSYAVLEEIFDEVLRREQLLAASYRLFAHSAGAQVAHRAVLVGAVPRASQVIAANAGYYTLPIRSATWPYGLGGLSLAAEAECRAFARDLTVLLGEADKDPAHPSLNRSPQAMAQGEHRLARGENFHAVAAQRAQALACPFEWKLVRVPGVGHQNEGMVRAAADLLN